MDETRPRVLVIDDEPAIRDLIRNILAPVGYEVLEASGGADASRCAGPIHLLICDVRLAGEVGPEIAQALAERYPDMRTLYMSGTPEVARRLLPCGCHFLPKPFVPNMLVAMVRDLLGRPTIADEQA